MNTATIEELAYLIKQAKEEGLPQPIVFLGAGASKTGGVPLAREIIKDILEKYANNPKIKLLKEDSKTYPKLMECLTPFERNKLLKDYVDRAKVNVTHIYLAQLIIEGFVDYVLTVNFDNLMLRALALFNNFPATYDMAILKDLTTTSFKEKSVVYLHGQHHGLWLLNTTEEMAKVREIIPPILDSIKNQRPWIFIGYSGDDPIFEHIIKLGRFDNGLYWVTYYDANPSDSVCNNLLEKPNTNTFLITGYDSDSFMLKLNSELNLPQPLIIDKPFTSLKNTLDNIVDIDDKEHFKGVKERLEIAKKNVDMAVRRFEEGKVESNDTVTEELAVNLIKKQIIDKILNGDFKQDEIDSFTESARILNNDEINMLISTLYTDWGNTLSALAKAKKEESLFDQALEKFKKAVDLNSKNDSAFNSWGNVISDLADLKRNESLYEQSFEKYKRATELNPKKEIALNNWGNAIYELAKLKNDEMLYKQSFEKYQRATELNPRKDIAFNNWGNAVFQLALLKKDETLFLLAFEKYKRATELNMTSDLAFSNWGNAMYQLAKLKKDEFLFESAFEKLKRATDLNPKNDAAFYNWGNAFSELARLKNDEASYEQGFEKFKRATTLNPRHQAAFSNWGGGLYDLAKIKNDEALYKLSFEKYKIAEELDPNDAHNLYNWGTAIHGLAKQKNDEALYTESFEKLNRAFELNGKSYNLACAYALKPERENALKILEHSLKTKEVETLFVENDEDWKVFLDDVNFIALLKKYQPLHK